MAKATEDVHQNRIIHKGINSNIVLIQTGTILLKIIDSGISTKPDFRMKYPENPVLPECTSIHNTPGQTGPINRTVDYSTDLFSTGVIFYEILTGRIPFGSSDPMGTAHCPDCRLVALDFSCYLLFLIFVNLMMNYLCLTAVSQQ
jgi:serine/threonine protein kinase